VSGSSTNGTWRGLAPGAEVNSYNYDNGPADPVTGYLNDVAEAVADGIHIANNSWGDSGCTPYVYGRYAGRAPYLDGIVRDNRIAIVFSAGNERDGFGASNDKSCVGNDMAPFANYGTINHPKAAKNVLVVGAVDSSNGAMSTYSSWGPTSDGRLNPRSWRPDIMRAL
jgi:Subtilase family